MQAADIMIHIDETLDDGQQQTLEAELRDLDGVVTASFNKAHFLLVSYESENTDAARLLDAVTSRGHEAQLVGM